MSEWTDTSSNRRDSSEQVLVIRASKSDFRRIERERVREAIGSFNRKKAILLIKKRRLARAHESYDLRSDSPRNRPIQPDNMQAFIIALHTYGPLLERLSKG